MITKITTVRQGIFCQDEMRTTTKKNHFVPNKIIQVNPEIVKAEQNGATVHISDGKPEP